MAIQDPAKLALNQQLERIGFGLFLIMIGGLALVPHELVPSGAWLIGAGLIMLGLNLARYTMGIPTSHFTIGLGILALLGGLGDVLGVGMPTGPIILILIGANILYDIWSGQKT